MAHTWPSAEGGYIYKGNWKETDGTEMKRSSFEHNYVLSKDF